MRQLFKKLRETITSGGDAVLVTVVASSGSTPRGSGARMLVTSQGRERGTIGGGAVEYKSEQIARDVLAKKCSYIERFRLQANDAANLGMICGGAVDVFFHYIPPYDRTMSLVTEQAERFWQMGEPFWLICELTEGQEGNTSVYSSQSGTFGSELPQKVLERLSRYTQMIVNGNRSYYCEQLLTAGRVFIFGGGHVTQELVAALARVDFRCVVLEDRQDFARRELFSGVERILLVDFADLTGVIGEIGSEDYVCVMTRGHQHDFAVLQQVLTKTKARYVGVIGSSQKDKAVKEKLAEAGCTQEELARITSPIGMNIGGKTPAEIAVSIAAQLICIRSGLQPVM